jgi:hypothetical protein
MTFLAWVLAGALLAAVIVALVRGRAAEVGLWRVGLVVAALVYPAAAAAGGGPTEAVRELAAALPWIAVAIASRRFGLLVLATGWALHGVWDMIPVMRSWMPDFYPPLCLGFDLAACLRLLWIRYSP